MKRLTQLFTLLLALSLPALHAASDKENIYISESGYTITFPKDWKTGSGWAGEDVYAMAPIEGDKDQFHENVTVVVDFVGDRSLQDFYDLNLNGLELVASEFNLVDSGDVKLGDQPAKYLIFTHEAGSFTFKDLQYLVIHDQTGFAITCTATLDAFDKYRPIFEKVAQSFRIQPEEDVELQVVEEQSKQSNGNN